MLAERGMTGPSPVFEGVGGYFKAVTRKSFQLAELGGPRHPFKIMECSIKRFPLGLYSQTVVQAALEVRDKVRSADDIAEVRIRTGSTAVRLMAGDPEKWAPATRETADHSMPYTVAVALMHGTVEARHFDDEYLRDPKLLALTKRVKVEASQEADRRMPEAMLCELKLVTKSGMTHSAVVEYHKGHWKNPMTDAEVEAKFHKLADGVLPSDRTSRLLERLWKLEDAADAGEIVRLTVASR
jgi:2-methylcitrate dehydratase